jgi:5'-phosphate synthase pdxT subunit
VLALQGDVVEHVGAFARLGVRAVPVKTAADLERVDALVIPGGESTTVIKLLDRADLADPIRARVAGGMGLWGTCMGMIVASKGVSGREQPTLGLLDVTVRRNAFGRQIDSAEVPLAIPALGEPPFPAIFIRAPWIERTGEQVEVLASVDGHPVFVRQGRVMATSFHPELGNDSRVHEFFLKTLGQKEESPA